jgi:hypothetical protein
MLREVDSDTKRLRQEIERSFILKGWQGVDKSTSESEETMSYVSVSDFPDMNSVNLASGASYKPTSFPRSFRTGLLLVEENGNNIFSTTYIRAEKP